MTEPKLNPFGPPLSESPDFIPMGPHGEVDWQRVWAVVPQQHMIDVLLDWAEEQLREREAQAQGEELSAQVTSDG